MGSSSVYTAMQHNLLFPKCYVILYVFVFNWMTAFTTEAVIMYISHFKHHGLILLSVHFSVTSPIITVSQRPTT